MRNKPQKPSVGMRRPTTQVFFKGRRTCPFSGPKAQVIDYKDVKLLSRFVTERGRIMPRRVTFVSAIKQRELAQAIKRARFLALMPFINK